MGENAFSSLVNENTFAIALFICIEDDLVSMCAQRGSIHNKKYP